ncbi:hypothetical protein CRE_27607 [Caenorhabditis remanei]|uniref:Uncharacterized protein n=1 Tax=Caenorhabditis remanei TaxID=31234 RepID=E3MKH5_CAERE|nr:hypothetical protein CRE_27607 [Caenorhabditis remanei]
MAEKSPIDVLENHLDAVRNAMSIRNNTSLYQLVNNGTDLDSFFALSSANVKSLRFNHKIHKAVNSVKSVVSQIEGTVTFTYSHSEGTNSYLTKVFLQKNSKSPTGWKLVKAKICTDAECSKVPS